MGLHFNNQTLLQMIIQKNHPSQNLYGKKSENCNFLKNKKKIPTRDSSIQRSTADTNSFPSKLPGRQKLQTLKLLSQLDQILR